jgi:hypothetical protein
MYSSTRALTSALDGNEWSTLRFGRFTPGKDPAPIIQRVLGLSRGRWASETVLTGAENLALSGIRSPDRPARSESLYRLRYLGFDGGQVPVENRSKQVRRFFRPHRLSLYRTQCRTYSSHCCFGIWTTPKISGHISICS